MNRMGIELKELWAWICLGLRSGVFLNSRLEERGSITPLRFLFLYGFVVASSLLIGYGLRWGQSSLDINAWFTSWWYVGFNVLVAWFIWSYFAIKPHLEGADDPLPQDYAAPNFPQFYLAILFSSLVASVLYQIYYVGFELHAQAIEQTLQAFGLTSAHTGWLGFAVWWLIFAMEVGAALTIVWRVTRRLAALIVYAAFMCAVLGVYLIYFDSLRLWTPNQQSSDSHAERFVITQSVFEGQQKLLQQAIQSIPARKPNQINLYGIVFAPYAPEKVFRNEAQMVAEVMQSNLHSRSTIQLVNSVATTQLLPWASPENLEKTIAAYAQKMDVKQDVLMLYLTSHGAKDGLLAANHWPLTVDSLLPSHIATYLDQYKIQHAVIIISACYSGSWIKPLASDHRLIITAADADHTSYGCGSKSELTYFGRAYFDEALRETKSLERAFEVAVPVIKQREIDAGKDDGFSNPQISIGSKIRPLLLQLEQQRPKGKQ